MHDCEYWNIETCHKWSIVTGLYPLMKPLGGGDKRKFTWNRSCLTSYGNRYVFYGMFYITVVSHGTQWSWNLITYLWGDKGMGLTNCHKGTEVTVPKTETAALVLCEMCNEHNYWTESHNWVETTKVLQRWRHLRGRGWDVATYTFEERIKTSTVSLLWTVAEFLSNRTPEWQANKFIFLHIR